MEKTKIKNLFDNVKELFFNCFRYIRRNNVAVILICLACITLVQLAMAGFMNCLFLLVIANNENGYMTFNNLGDYFGSPLYIISLVIYVIVLCNVLFFQISLFVYIFEKSKKKEKVKFKEMMKFGAYGLKKLFKPKNWLAYVFILVIIPFADILQFTYYQASIVVPGFILDVILSKPYFAVPYIILVAAVLIFGIFSVFSFHYFLLEDISFFEACKKSVKLYWKQFKEDFTLAIVVFVTLIVGVFLLALIIVLIMGLFNSKIFDRSVFFDYVNGFAKSLAIIVTLPITYATISVQFHFYHHNSEVEFDSSKLEGSKVFYTLISSMSFLFVVVFAVADVVTNLDNYKVYNIQSSEPIVIAHRGSSIDAPENSIPAFELAIEQGVDVIEIDVHQTKDKVLVVCHDASLSRIAGIDKNVYELNYDEISKLDVGSWFSDEYKGLKMAKLEEVLVLCKDKIDILIEIKPTDYDDGLEEDLLALINKYDMKDQVSIHSLKTAPLEKLDELDPSLEIALCTNLAIGSVEKISWSDYYTVEENYITPELVRTIHETGKKIYVWTINEVDNVQFLIDCGVDGFIGDDPILLQDAIKDAIYDKGFSKILRMFSLHQLIL